MDNDSPSYLDLSPEIQDLIAKASLIDVNNTKEYKSIMEEIATAISNISISDPTAFETIKNSEEFKFFEFAMKQSVRDEENIISIEDEKIDFFVSEEILKKADELNIDEQYRKEFFEIENMIEADNKTLERLKKKADDLSDSLKEVYKEQAEIFESLEDLRETRVKLLSSHSNKIKKEFFVPKDHPNVQIELKNVIRFFLGDPHEYCANSFIFYCKKGFLDKTNMDLTPNFGRQLEEDFVQTFYSKQLFKQYDKNEKYVTELENYIRYTFKELSFKS